MKNECAFFCFEYLLNVCYIPYIIIIILVIIIQYLYSAMKSEDTEALGGTRLREVKQVGVFKCRLKVSVDVHRRILSGSEFQTDSMATEKA